MSPTVLAGVSAVFINNCVACKNYSGMILKLTGTEKTAAGIQTEKLTSFELSEHS